ncbi:3-oxoacyl-[acyl-carrier-protein] synthase 3 [Clostridia bacterium]|nr:3-oxoacyl-[acyl-carrier-protein] synthase 3 [Clostridia bacterium]
MDNNNEKTLGLPGLRIIGTGSHIPPVVKTNDEFREFIDTTDEWIAARTGIRERHYNFTSQNHVMGADASEKALLAAGVPAGDIDLIIAVTCTADYFYPALSTLIQKQIGADNAACFDVNLACAGFVAGLDIAHSYLTSGKYEKILVVSSETLSKHTDFRDRSTCILSGDGAGAAVVVPASGKAFVSHLGAEGEVAEDSALYCKTGCATNAPFPEAENAEKYPETPPRMIMDGHAVYKFAVSSLSTMVKAVTKKAGVNISDVDMFITHQANLRIIESAMAKMKVPAEKYYVNIHKYGNMSSACIPVCLDELYRSGKIVPGMKLCLLGYGGGLAYGGIYMES